MNTKKRQKFLNDSDDKDNDINNDDDVNEYNTDTGDTSRNSNDRQ